MTTSPQKPPTKKLTIALIGLRNLFAYHLLRRLPAHPSVHKVIAFDIHPSSTVKTPPDPSILVHKLELTNPTCDAQLATTLREENVDILLHLSFLEQPVRDTAWSHELESIGTMHILNACAAVQLPKLIVRSSTVVYGPNPQNPNHLDENHPFYPSSQIPFIKDKIDAERQIQNFREWNPLTQVSVLRYCPILGPNSKDFIIPYISQPLGRRLLGYDPLIQLMDEDDAIVAIEKSIFSSSPGIFNIAADGVLPLSHILKQMGSLRLPLPLSFARPFLNALWILELENFPPAFIDFLRYPCIVANRRAKKQLDFSPRFSTQETISRYRQSTLLNH